MKKRITTAKTICSYAPFVSSESVSAYHRGIGGFLDVVSYINPRFTYPPTHSLTYLFTYLVGTVIKYDWDKIFKNILKGFLGSSSCAKLNLCRTIWQLGEL